MLVLYNMVDVWDNYVAVFHLNYVAVFHLNALVSSQNIGMGYVKTSLFQDLAFSFQSNNHVSYSLVNTMINRFTVAAVTVHCTLYTVHSPVRKNQWTMTVI